jgi:hypothetical protein
MRPPTPGIDRSSAGTIHSASMVKYSSWVKRSNRDGAMSERRFGLAPGIPVIAVEPSGPADTGRSVWSSISASFISRPTEELGAPSDWCMMTPFSLDADW